MCFGLLRFLTFIFNFVVWLAGLVVVVVAIYLRFEPDLQSQLLDAATNELFDIFIYTCVGTGVTMVLIGFLGCCGAYYRSVWMMFVFFAVIVLLFCIEIAAASLLYVRKDKIASRLDSDMDMIFQSYRGADRQIKEEFVDLLQNRFNCCGWQSPSDYHSSSSVAFTGGANQDERLLVGFPDSCCVNRTEGCGLFAYYILNSWRTSLLRKDANEITSQPVKSKGCREEIRRLLEKSQVPVILLTALFSVLQMVAMLSAFYMANRIRTEELIRSSI